MTLLVTLIACLSVYPLQARVSGLAQLLNVTLQMTSLNLMAELGSHLRGSSARSNTMNTE